MDKRDRGEVRICQKNFSALSKDFFALGVCEDYYDSIKSNFPDDKQREEIFCALNDIAFDLELFDKVKKLGCCSNIINERLYF